MKEFLRDKILPEWRNAISNSSNKERKNGVIHRGQKFVWEQVLKDIQKFYRLLFKHRFHRLDKRNDELREVLVQKSFEELGLNHTGDYQRAFHYFYPVLNKLRKGDL